MDLEPALAVLLSARLLPLALLLPGTVGGVGSRLASGVLGLALGASLLPIVEGLPHPPRTLDTTLLPVLASELLRGVVFALAVTLPLHAFAWTGTLIERVRGEAPAFEDAGDDGASPMALLYRYGALAVLFGSGAHLLVMDALADSLVRFPLGSVPDTSSVEALVRAVVAVVSRALALTISLAAPVLLCVVVLTLAIGLVTRVSAPLAPALLQGPLVPTLALGVVCLVAAATLPEAETALRVFLQQAERALRLLG